MKQVFLLLTMAVLTTSATKAQQSIDLRRKINVSGTAETELTPDIIKVSISLKEYLENGNSKKKVDITTLENQLYAAVKNAGIPKEKLTINNISSWNSTAQKRKNPDFLASKQYLLTLSDLNKLNQILGDVDAKGIQNTTIQSYDFSNMETIKKDLKIKALMAAKEKATYMVEALGATLGDVLEITDGNDSPNQPIVYRNYAMLAKTDMGGAADMESADLEFKTVKLSFTVNVVFEIK